MAVYALAWHKPANPSSGPQVRRYPEAATQTFVKGDPVKIDSAGRVLLAVDTETGPFGIANGDASGTTDALVSVTVLTLGDILSASGSAAGATRTVTRSDVGLRCSWIKSSISGETTKSVIDVNDTTTPAWEILDNLDAVGVTDGRYLVRLIADPVMRAA
jgi:hypothetical protein